MGTTETAEEAERRWREVAALAERVERIERRLEELPGAADVERLEHAVRRLEGAVDRQQETLTRAIEWDRESVTDLAELIARRKATTRPPARSEPPKPLSALLATEVRPWVAWVVIGLLAATAAGVARACGVELPPPTHAPPAHSGD